MRSGASMPKFLRLVSFLLFLGPSSCVLIYQTGEVEETENGRAPGASCRH